MVYKKKKRKNLTISGDKKCDWKYSFEFKPTEISKENKRLRKIDDEILKSLKLSHYMSSLPLYNLLNCLDDLNLSRWYHSSLSLSYTLDHLSVKAHTYFTPDEEFELYVDYLYQEFLEYLKKVKKLRRLHTSKIKVVCEWFIYNLSRCLSKGKQSISYYRAPISYIKTKKELGLSFPYTVMHNLVDFLEYNKKIITLSGYNLDSDSEGDPVPSLMIIVGDLSKYYSGVEKVIDTNLVLDELVQVREKVKIGKRKESLPLEIIPEWEHQIEEDQELMITFNNTLDSRVICVNGHIIPDIWFKRIYTYNLDLCGRFFDFGQYQRFDKLSRKTTTIDKESTVRWDFDSLHPSLLYELEGIKLAHDPYPIIKIKHSKVLVNKFKKYYGYDKYSPERNLCKLVMLCMINACGREDAISAVVNKLYLDRSKIGCPKRESSIKFCGLPMNPDIGQIMDIIEECNEPIRQYFYTGIGLKLMNYDSKIMEFIIRRCINHDIVILPLHDETVCKKSEAALVKSFMEEGYRLVMGSDLNCNIGED